jgi:single-strand DNA-binding protein
MASYNRSILIGNLTNDVEVRQAGERDVAKFSIAVNSPFKKGKVLFMDCEYWRGGAVVEYLQRGTPVLVEGELDQQVWEKDGQKRSKVILNVSDIRLLGGKRETADEEEFASEFR